MPIAIVRSQLNNFIVSFENKFSDSSSSTFEPIQKYFTIIMKNNEGNYWNVLGECVERNRVGEWFNLRIDNFILVLGTVH